MGFRYTSSEGFGTGNGAVTLGGTAAVVGAPMVRRWTLVLALAVLNLLDMVTTRTVLGLGGEEFNPLMRNVVDDFWHGVGLKGAVIAVAGVLLTRCPDDTRRPETVAAAVCGLYLAVVLWNTAVILRATA
jgi:hypothetical protein